MISLPQKAVSVLARVLLLALVGGLGLGGATASAAGPSVGEITLAAGANPFFGAIGRDGSLWVTEEGAAKIARIDSAGQLREFRLRAGIEPYDIVAGPDGALWFTESLGSRIGRITTDGAVREFRLPPRTEAFGLTIGADRALWFATGGSTVGIGRLTTGGALTLRALHVGPWVTDVALGSDGALWLTQGQSLRHEVDRIVRVGPDGKVQSFQVPTRRAYPFRIVAGPDGSLWFTEATANRIGRITPAGRFREFRLPAALAGPGGIAVGADGALWFTGAGGVGRITQAGRITAYPIGGSGRLLGIVARRDGSFWLVDEDAGRILHFTPG